MARPAARYLMSALARRSKQEDQLTEVFASTLAADAEFGAAMLARIGMPGHQLDEVHTQARTGIGLRTMDMRLRVSKDGVPAGEVWCEHKVESPFGDDQLPKYAEALVNWRHQGRTARFVTITHLSVSLEERSVIARMRGVRLTWRDVADVLDGVLTALDPEWFQAATSPNAPVRLRVLAELAVYLQEFAEVAVVEPLDADKLAALRLIDDALKSSEELLRSVATSLHQDCLGEFDYDTESAGESWLNVNVRGWWNSFPDGHIELWIGPRAWFSESADRVPSFGLAVIIPGETGERLKSDNAFTDAVESANFGIGEYYENGELTLTWNVELDSVAGLSLGKQAHALADSTRNAMAAIAACVPARAKAAALPRGVAANGVFDPLSSPTGTQ